MSAINKCIVILLLTAFICKPSLAQQSDYQLTKEFEASIEKLEDQILGSASLTKLAEVQQKFDSLEITYSSDKDLLNHALYPNTFSGVFENNNRKIQAHKKKLLLIERQKEELSSLSNKLIVYRNEIAFINSRTDSLRHIIKNGEEDRADLNYAIAQYRIEISRRDDILLNIVDSLFTTVSDLETKKGLESGDELPSFAFSKQDHPLKYLQVMIDENISTLKYNQHILNVDDYIRMYVVQQRFKQAWDQIGGELSSLYGQDNAAVLKSELDHKIRDWEATASRNMWLSLNNYLKDKEIDLPAFDNNGSFYAALNSFIHNEVNSSRDHVLKDDFYDQFQSFYEIWKQKIKDDWGELIEDGEVLTMSQISTIDAEIMHWKSEVEPRSYTIPILLSLSLIAIVGLVIALARKK